ncbi:MAG: type II secretion system secretin GspD [Deltaproteobacteria bacterium]|nr:type II secretion system secretin GspD [Deltaproteobacteria bacterium]
MNFKDAELEAVVKFISELMGMNFILDDKVKGKVTVISPTQLTVEEAYEVFQAILVVKGFTIVPAGRVFKIVPTREAKQGNIETVTDKVAPGDRFVTRIMPLRRVPVENLTGILAPLVSKDGSLVPYGPTNTLIITDSYSNIERLGEIVHALDVDTVDSVLEIIPIRYAAAENIAKTLLQTVADKSKGQAAKRRPGAPAGAAGGAPAAAAVPAAESGAKIISDTRTNSLIVIADPATLEEIKSVIRALDVEIAKGTGKINVYYLRYADAENVASVLTAISKNAGPKAKPGQPGQPPQAAQAAPRVAGEIAIELEEAVQITADKATNSLVIIATPQDYELLKTVIAKLDIRRPQVLVEALILEMNYQKSLELGVEWRISDSNPTSGGTKVVGGSSFGNIATAMANPLALGSGLVLAAVDGTITYGSQTFANVAAMVKALQTAGDINVLSTPHLLTTNNEEAEIIVSDNIPFQTSQKFDNNGNPIYTFDYKDVGLTLRMTPQINDDGYVKLKVFQEVSQLLSATTGTNSNAPSTSKRQAKTTVVVKDAATVVIGGLVKDNTLKNISSVPCLGDIPLLGYLFRNSTVRKEKVNLLIFLTPHVITSTEDLEKISEQKRQEYDLDTRNPAGGAEGAAEKMRRYISKPPVAPAPPAEGTKP